MATQCPALLSIATHPLLLDILKLMKCNKYIQDINIMPPATKGLTNKFINLCLS